MSKSFPCPSCGNQKTGVLDSRPSSKDGQISVRRRRKCEKCGHRMTTHETGSDQTTVKSILYKLSQSRAK